MLRLWNGHRWARCVLTLISAGLGCGSVAPTDVESRQEPQQKHPGPPLGNFWSLSDTLLPQGNATNVISVALQTTPAVVAAFGTPVSGGGGLIQVQTYSSTTHIWDATATIPGSYAAISNNVLVVGTPSVSVDLYTAPNWTWAARLYANVALASSEYGRALAIDGPTIVVGAPSAHLEEGRAFIFELLPFTLGGTTYYFWQQTAVLGDQSVPATAVEPIEESLFGAGVSVSGSVVAVGQTPDSPDANGHEGRVFLFEKQANWTLVDTVFPHDPLNPTQLAPASDTKAQSFGKAVIVKGNTLAVRSTHYVQVFTRSPGQSQWSFTRSFDVGLSGSTYSGVPLAFDGAELISGDSFEESNAGRVYPLLGTRAHPVSPFQVPPPGAEFIEERPLESNAMFGQCVVTAGGWLLVGDHMKHVRVYARTPYW